MTRGLITERKRPSEIQSIIQEEPAADIYGLRFPERDAKKPADFMRVIFKKEDEQFLVEQKRFSITDKEQKRLPREILTDNWQEDMSLYKNKRRP